MKAVKISNTLSGVENNGTVKILLSITKENFELLRTRPFPEADINEAITFFPKRDYLEERLNQMQDKLDRLEGNGQILPSYQPMTKKEAEIIEEEVTFTPDVNIITEDKKDEIDEELNKKLLLGILGELEEDEKEN